MYKKIKTAMRDCSPKCKFIRFGCIIATLIVSVSILSNEEIDVRASIRDSVNTNASKYISEKYEIGDTIDMEWNGVSYYFIPFTKDGILPANLPGMFFDVFGRPVNESNILVDLYRYPALIMEYGGNISVFRQEAYEITKMLSKDCMGYVDDEGKIRWCEIGENSWKVLSAEDVIISTEEVENSIFALGQLSEYKKWFELRDNTNIKAGKCAEEQMATISK